MSTLTFAATGRFKQQIRFVIINERIPRADEHCALCSRMSRTAISVIHRRG